MQIKRFKGCNNIMAICLNCEGKFWVHYENFCALYPEQANKIHQEEGNVELVCLDCEVSWDMEALQTSSTWHDPKTRRIEKSKDVLSIIEIAESIGAMVNKCWDCGANFYYDNSMIMSQEDTSFCKNCHPHGTNLAQLEAEGNLLAKNIPIDE